MQTDNLQQLDEFLQRITSESRIRPAHVSVYAALCLTWIGAQCVSPFTISRKMIMEKSMIRSKVTYHNVIKDLQRLGYITDNPSFHPGKRTSIALLTTR